MKLTVVSASYNALSSVGLERMTKSIRSVAALPLEHEHLIFDGASTDGTTEALLSLAAEIPSLRVVSERDSGIYEALNKGVQAARGDYFYVLGLDDLIIDTDAFRDCMLNAEREQADILIAKVKWGDSAHTFPVRKKDIYDCFLHHSYSHQGCLIKTDKIKKVGFDESYRIAADYKQLLTLHWNGAKVTYRDRVIAEFATTGLSAAQTEKAVVESKRCQREVFGGLPLVFVMLAFLLKRGEFSRRIAFRIFSYICWHKTKATGISTYRLLGIPVFAHKSKVS